MNVGDSVKVRESETFGDYDGNIVSINWSRGGGRKFYRIVFPSHPWCQAGESYAFAAHELEPVAPGDEGEEKK